MSNNSQLAGKKILFANFPADGHFNPMTGLAVYLKSLGCEVRWYTSSVYAARISKLQVKHYPFQKALDATGVNVDEVFPERKKLKGQVKKLRFDMIHAFILRAPEYYADILEIRKEFNFDLVVADCAFSAIPFIKEKIGVPVVSLGILPLTETSKDLPPPGIGMTPSYTWFGKIKQAVLRYVANKILFGEPNKVMQDILDKYAIPHNKESVFDLLVKKSSIFLQSGTPAFEYYRSDLGTNIRYIGALLPYSSPRTSSTWFDERLNKYEKVVIVTQGTVEKDIEKILVPTLEAFKNTSTLVIATTGGSGTQELRARFPHKNLVIEDFIPFADIMPYADVYITNGGYGGVMLGIENQLPMVVAGIHEGKNEINARIGYFKLGINLKTELPTPKQMKDAVEKIIKDENYKNNVVKLAKDFRGYNPNELCTHYINEILQKTVRVVVNSGTNGEKVY
jgi:MGT family glycosyltransferase